MSLELPKLERLADGRIKITWANGGYAVWSAWPGEPVLVQYANGERIELHEGKVTAVYCWTRRLEKY